MKPLKEMTNTEKAKLLATLFPEHIQPIVANISAGCRYIIDNQDIVKEEWDNPILRADFWIQLAQDVFDVLKVFRASIGKSAAVFSDQLFFSFRAVVSIEYLLRYAMALDGERQFRLTVQMLFEQEAHDRFSLSN